MVDGYDGGLGGRGGGVGGERPNEVASAAEDPISEHGNHVSDAARVKAVCWRGSPDPLQRPRSARLLGEGLAGRFKRSRSLCGRSHQSGRRNRPQRWSSSRLCRVDPALVQRGRSGGAAAPPEHTECCGRCWRAEKGLHHWGGRRRDRSCAHVRLLRHRRSSENAIDAAPASAQPSRGIEGC